MKKAILPEDELLKDIDANWQQPGRILYQNWLNILVEKSNES